MTGAIKVATAVCLTLLMPATSALADIHVGTGSRLIIGNSAEMDAGCTAITLASGGSLEIDQGRIAACGNFTLESGSSFTDGSGTLEFNGTWSNDSEFRNSLLYKAQVVR